MQAGFSTLQYVILILYVLLSLIIGLWFARHQRTVEGYYLAERSAPWWALAISIISSDTTAISYLGCAAIVFQGDLQLSIATLAYPFSGVFVALLFVPFLARHKVFTVYEYLERRFNVHVRTIASALFLLTRGSHISVALYAAALVFAEVMGVSIWVGLLVLGGLTTVYTVFGGMKAVLWTDVIQFFVLTVGLVAVLIGVAAAFHWDLGEIWRIASHPSPSGAPWLDGKVDAPSHTRAFEFGFSLSEMNFWAVIVWAFLSMAGSYGSDQVLVQRYLAAGSRKAMAASLIGGSLLNLPTNIVMFGTGVFLTAFYSHFLHAPGHEWVASLTDSNRVMSHYISYGLPGTLGALVIAGLFAGTMSSFSAGLNSLSTATYVDFVTRFTSRPAGEKSAVACAKVITCAWGVLVISSAALMGGGDTIFAIVAKVTSPFAGPLLGMFLLGMLSKRANSFGVIAGALVGAAATLWVTYFTRMHWMWYFGVGCGVGVVSGYLLSFPISSRSSEVSPEPESAETFPSSTAP